MAKRKKSQLDIMREVMARRREALSELALADQSMREDAAILRETSKK